jgi:oligopeptide transport system substrate-binding protein
MTSSCLHQFEPIQSDAPVNHVEKMVAVLRKLLFPIVYFQDKEAFAGWTKTDLPMIRWETPVVLPGSLSIFLVCPKPSQPGFESLLFDFLKQQIAPGKVSALLAFSQLHFYFQRFSDTPLFVGEYQILIETAQELHEALDHLPLLPQALMLPLSIPFQLSHLKVKRNSSYDLQLLSLYQHLHRLSHRFPHLLDELLIEDLDRLVALCPREFLAQRKLSYSIRLVVANYLMRKKILQTLTQSSNEQPIEFHLMSTTVEFPFCHKPVLGCLIHMGQHGEYELLENRHLLVAIKKLIPEAMIVQGSSYTYDQKEESLKTFYLELEKEDGTPFSLKERKLLRHALKTQIKQSTEKLAPAIVMIRNEEEVFKNILVLRREILSPKDLPQVMISLEGQNASSIVFNAICVTIDRMEKRVEQSALSHFVTLEREHLVGYLRKKYPIKAYILQLAIPKEPAILRSDLGINFYAAREKAVSLVEQTVGPFRDYNGGLIFKQNETLASLKQNFKKESMAHSDIIDDFFYAIRPIEKQAVLQCKTLIPLFSLWMQAFPVELQGAQNYSLTVHQEGFYAYALLRYRDSALKHCLTALFEKSEFSLQELIQTELQFQGVHIQGYLYEQPQQSKRDRFLSALQETVTEWYQQKPALKVLRLSIPYSLTSLDPRLAGDEFTGSVLRLLFEGLMRLGRHGELEYGMAESVEISSDQRHYLFKLRKALWSNNTPVLAYDFEYSWKKILSPDFKTAYAYLFYPIKHAREVKQGLLPLDHAGIRALDDQTLLVELAFPAPYFLELTAHTIYSPVCHRLDLLNPNWSLQSNENYVSNGGFLLLKSHAQRYFELSKNRVYWDAKQIEIESILISKNTPRVAKQQFQQQQLDWIGQPFGPWDPQFEASDQDRVISSAISGVYWYVFNTKRFPFCHVKFRKAFALAVDRHQICSALKHKTLPAYSPLIPVLNLNEEKMQLEESLVVARRLFKEAQDELGLSMKEFPVITLLYAEGGTRDIAAQQISARWQQVFNIRCRLEPLDWQLAFRKMKEGDFHICGILWRSLVNDPIYILNSFRDSFDSINLARWENPTYKKLLEEADCELDPVQRIAALTKAHNLLIEEIPVIPAFYTQFSALVKNDIEPPSISPYGIMDLKWTKVNSPCLT